jgi:hypothetical protein
MYEMYEYQDFNPFLFYSEKSLEDFNSVPRFCSLIHALPKVAKLPPFGCSYCLLPIATTQNALKLVFTGNQEFKVVENIIYIQGGEI